MQSHTDLTKKQQKQVQGSTGYTHEQLERENETLIPEDQFEDYAQELAEDIGAINREYQWPLYCIDWEWAAIELKHDYTSATVEGQDYLMRAF